MNVARNEAPRRVVDETRRLYADLLSQPLDDKQLARPSFKFIQDIVKKLITETRTLRNVFNPSDFDTQTKNWDKRMRANFVQRLINFAANHKEPVVGCVAAKLVAGLDPTKSNELLQALAKIAQARVAGNQVGKGPRTFTRTLQPETTTSSRGKANSRGPTRPGSTERADQNAAMSRRSSGDRSRLGSSAGTSSRQSSSVTRRGSSGGSTKENVKPVSGTIGAPSRRTSGLESSPTSSGQDSRSRRQLSSNNRDPQVAKQPIGQIDSLSTATTPKTVAMGEPKLKPGAKRESLAGTSIPFVPSNRLVVDVKNDGDMSKNIQLLRANMRQFRTLLGEIGQLETGLKFKLVKYE